jgi:multiple sugar transport system substrate-binding protein
VPDDHTGPVYTYADPKNMVVFNTCKAPQAAWAFIKTMIDKSGDLQLLEVTGQLPRRKNWKGTLFMGTILKRTPCY